MQLACGNKHSMIWPRMSQTYVWKNQCPTCSEHPCSDVERTWSGTSQKGTGVLKMKGVSQKLQFLRSNASDVSTRFRFRKSVQFTLLHLSPHVLKCIWEIYIYICVCVWHLLWEHQAGTFSVIFLAAKALAMVLLSSTSTSLSDIFLHWVWTLLHSWHHKPRHCKYIVKVLPTVGMFEIATLNLELNLCL